MIISRSGELCVVPVNGMYVNCIRVNDALYTVDPNLINKFFEMNFH